MISHVSFINLPACTVDNHWDKKDRDSK